MQCGTMIRFLQLSPNRLMLSEMHMKKREYYVRKADEELDGRTCGTHTGDEGCMKGCGAETWRKEISWKT
jgi:hypothetical protein